MWDNSYEEILRRHLPFLSDEEELESETNLRDYGLDSLAMVELLSAIEGFYGTRLAEDALTLETFETAGSLWRALDASLQTAN
ncbi:acyl carrier protein [Streptomyces millisiae]|uniref:Acyl carrier protein n=1 Tax=Streptomyces millisiae TaxID=3075542 RepID=A0ABU2LQC6_9ACTN|nr:acyl carrier protein [Streptomyces sp. DSM 44918]MDT0319786.1 acyl carrier protein [Streptomyces sp. DSM 44918]